MVVYKMKQYSIIALLILISVVSCERPKDAAIGYDHVISVVCDERNWEVAEPILNETLGKVYQTPPTETLYIFQRVSPQDLNTNILNKNVMILTRLEEDSEVTPHVKSMLPDTTIKRMLKNPKGYYAQADAYAKGQALVVVVGTTLADLRNRLKVNQNQIFNFIEQTMYKRNTAFIYRSGEQFELAQKYYDQYGYYMRMMHDFVEIENNPKTKLVWLGRDFPYRWLTVTWDTPGDTLLEVQLNDLLKRTFGSRLKDVKLNMDYLTVEPTWFKSYSAYKFYGLWESTVEVKGGPFIAYGFYEPVKDRIYLISGIVHAPNKAKMPYIRQLETIIRTFDTEIFEEE
mgnify:CR=1 FL=1